MSSQPLPTFRQKWVDFRRRCLDGHIHPALMKVEEDVFYAGALAYINSMRRAFEQGISGADFRDLHLMMENEIRTHFEYFETNAVH